MSDQLELFSVPKQTQEPVVTPNLNKPRLNTACRNQYLIPRTIDDSIPKDHLVRSVWNYVQSLDLTIVLNKIRSVENNVGRPATDPKILLALWLFAIIKGIGSARVIEEYCHEHDAFRWICGDVNVNYHTISDFRTKHGDQLNELLTMSVVALSDSGLISLERISQDGMRVRANAGSGSFRREGTIQDRLVLAEMLVEDLREEEKRKPGACKSRLAAAEKKVAEERARRLSEAKNTLEQIRQEKQAYNKQQQKKDSEEELTKVRASMTDPEARIMKMACSGYRPAYNVQFATTNIGKAIVGVDVTNKGVDNQQLLKMLSRVSSTYGVVPQSWLVDGGYESLNELNLAGLQYPKCKIYMPVKITSKNQANPYVKLPKDSEVVGEWRERMGTEEAKQVYQERSSTAEFVNAQSRNKGLQQFFVRGLEKVKCVALLYALAHNMLLKIGCEGIY